METYLEVCNSVITCNVLKFERVIFSVSLLFSFSYKYKAGDYKLHSNLSHALATLPGIFLMDNLLEVKKGHVIFLWPVSHMTALGLPGLKSILRAAVRFSAQVFKRIKGWIRTNCAVLLPSSGPNKYCRSRAIP